MRLFGDSSPLEPTLALSDGAEEGWGDCAFEANWRGQVARARAKDHDAVVGLDIEWPRDWEKVHFASDVPFSGFRATLTFRSCGSESNRFIESLARRYEVNDHRGPMLPTVTCTGISLEGDPRFARDQDVKLKLFFFEDDQERYAEAYLNVADLGGRIEFNEKDIEYRPLIISALTEA